MFTPNNGSIYYKVLFNKTTLNCWIVGANCKKLVDCSYQYFDEFNVETVSFYWEYKLDDIIDS